MIAQNKRFLRRSIRWIRAGLYRPLDVAHFWGVPLLVALRYLHLVQKIDLPLRTYFLKLGS